MGDTGVDVHRAGGVLTLTLDRAATKNAMDATMFAEFGERIVAAGTDPDVRVVVITGANGEFCSGADLGGLDRATHPYLMMDRGQRYAMELHRLRVPTIAKVDGVAVGMGMNIALLCDLVVASDRARFCCMFARRGLSPDFGGTWILPRLVGIQKAKELALLSEMIPAARAADLGLVNKVVPVDELDAAVDDWAGRLATGAPLALATTKRLIDESDTHSLEQALDAESRSQAIHLMSADAAEAYRAYTERREPRFTGGGPG